MDHEVSGFPFFSFECFFWECRPAWENDSVWTLLSELHQRVYHEVWRNVSYTSINRLWFRVDKDKSDHPQAYPFRNDAVSSADVCMCVCKQR